MSEDDNLRSGIVDGGFVHHNGHLGEGVGGGDADTAESERVGELLLHVA